MTNNTLEVLFVVFAFVVQVLLVFNFIARNWKPSLEQKYGWVIYTMGILGIILGVLFLAGEQPWYSMCTHSLFHLGSIRLLC